MSSQKLVEIMALVDDLAGACSPEAKNIARSLIAFKVAALTGDQPQQVFDALRAPPPNVLKVPSHQRAVKAPPAETLESAVQGVAAKLRLVPVEKDDEAGLPWGSIP